MKDIIYVGVNDHDIDLFEGQYIVPNGVSYNSYIIKDEKIAIMDTADIRKGKEWLENVKNALGEEKPDYLVVSHMEPDHASSIELLTDLYPDMKIVGNDKTFKFMKNFFPDLDVDSKKVVVKEKDTLELGNHTLTFIMAPFVHWPEVMMSYESTEKVLFSADGFGKFGALDVEEDWACEARRYYFNIVGKYGKQVQNVLKKAANLDIQTICPLHGPVLEENLGYYLGLYNTWSSYSVETEGVFIAYASIYGNTKEAALLLQKKLEEKGIRAVAADLAREDLAECVEDAFRHDRLVLAAPTQDAGVFSVMNDFIHHLASKSYQNRKIAFIENGSWAPMAYKTMKKMTDEWKNITYVEPVVTIVSKMSNKNVEEIEALADALAE